MTREEYEKELKYVVNGGCNGDCNGDYISRQAVLDEMYKRKADGDAITAGFIKGLPSVTPAEKQEPCEDVISRQSAISLASDLKHDLPDDDRLADMVMAHNEGILDYQTQLSLLPSVNQEPCEDAISRRAVLNTIRDWLKTAMMADGKPTLCDSIRDLPSVTSVEKVGRWIRITDKTGHFLTWQCDKCGLQHKFSTNYCSNCGAKMQEVEE
jgi:hypothetical protein